MSVENKYTSTGNKIMHHYEAIRRWKRGKLGTPISLQIAPTSRCNLKCSFCSNVNRDTHQDLNPSDLLHNIRWLDYYKTIEWTGGGEPTLWEPLGECIEEIGTWNVKQGLITNGTLLASLSKKTMESLSWIRISMNCIDYGGTPYVPEDFSGTLGFSYVLDKSFENLSPNEIHKKLTQLKTKIDPYIKKYVPSYVRIVPDCQTTVEQQVFNNLWYASFVWEEPYFYQNKTFKTPERCWWCYFKPFILHDGYVYPCSSVVLNDEAERSFHKNYRWVYMTELKDKYKNFAVPFSTENCSHCVFSAQNELMEYLLHGDGMEDFV